METRSVLNSIPVRFIMVPSFLSLRRQSLLLFAWLLVSGVTGCHRSKTIDIEGTVVDDVTGQPIPAATVSLHTHFRLVADNYFERPEATSDRQGVFRFSGLTCRNTRRLSTHASFRVRGEGYDYTYAYFPSVEEAHGIEIRLQQEPAVVLPRGYLKFHEQAAQADEPTLRFLFSDDQLQLAEPGQESDFELHYRFKPVVRKSGWNPGLGTLVYSKTGKVQYLDHATTQGNRIGQVFYREVNGQPPRLPDLKAMGLQDSCSFDEDLLELSSKHFLRHDFLLKTRSGKYALLHFSGDSINWVFQPDGSTSIWRTRMDNFQYLPH